MVRSSGESAHITVVNQRNFRSLMAKNLSLEEALIRAMKQLDTQVAREMQRTPMEREDQGVRRWEPHQKRVEKITALIVNSLGDQELELDSLLILSRGLAKALQIVVEDLGEDGLGAVRSEYCLNALRDIERSCREAEREFHSGEEMAN